MTSKRRASRRAKWGDGIKPSRIIAAEKRAIALKKKKSILTTKKK